MQNKITLKNFLFLIPLLFLGMLGFLLGCSSGGGSSDNDNETTTQGVTRTVNVIIINDSVFDITALLVFTNESLAEVEFINRSESDPIRAESQETIQRQITSVELNLLRENVTITQLKATEDEEVTDFVIISDEPSSDAVDVQWRILVP